MSSATHMAQGSSLTGHDQGSTPLYADDISKGIQIWMEMCVNELRAREVHVDVESNGTSFSVNCFGGVGFRKEELERVGGHFDDGLTTCDKALRFLSERSGLVRVESSNQLGLFDSVVASYGKGCRLLEMKQGIIDGFRNRKQGTRIAVRDWVDLGGAVPRRAVVCKIRSMIQNMALTTQNVTFTLYNKRTKKFVFKALGSHRSDEKAAAFFGHIDQELVAPIENARLQGWVVTGYTVLPPVGHASRSRQRIYFNSRVVECKKLQERIDILYRQVYQDTVKLLPKKNVGDLLSVKRSLNAHPMFILYISTENEDARKLEGVDCGILEYISISLIELVESALLQAWQKSLSRRMLGLLEARCHQVQEQESSQESGSLKRPQLVQKKSEDKFVGLSLCKRESLFEELETYRFANRLTTLDSFPKRRRSLQGKAAVENVLSSWKNPQLMMPHANRDSSFFMPVTTLQEHEQKCFTRLNPCEITREDLIGCRIVGQIDKKFVAFVSNSGKLGLVDQHAADERVRLERLQDEIFSEDNRPNHATVMPWKASENPQIHVGEDEAPLFEEYQKQAYMWGWRWEPWCQVSLRITVTHVPLICGRPLSPCDLKLYIYQLAHTAACNLAPQAVHRVLASVACRSAIMFGDVLGMDEARTLVSNLSETVQFYECAHGRPTVCSLAHIPSIRPRVSHDELDFEEECLLRSKLLHVLSNAG